MGTMRLFQFCCLFGGSAFAALGSNVDAQLTQSFGDRPTQNAAPAYYQPLTQSQYEQHRQTAYAQELPDDTQLLMIQQRAERMLQVQPSQPKAIAPPSNSRVFSHQETQFPRRTRGANVGYRRLQDDPFGEQQAQQDPFGESQAQPGAQVPPTSQFDPFADPPAQDKNSAEPLPNPLSENQTEPNQFEPSPPAQTEPAVTKPPVSQQFQPEVQPQAQPRATPQVDPGFQEPQIDPFADPPGAIVPDNAGQQTGEPNTDYPPGTVTPGDLPEPNVDSTPRNNYRGSGDLDVYDYHQGIPYQEPVQGDGVYRAPQAQSMPPIVQPRSTQPRMTAPSYQPPYQPIPGVQASPQYAQQYTQQYAQPQYVQPQYSQPQYPAQSMTVDPGAYTNVVDQCGDDCQTCDTTGCPNFYFSMFGGVTELRDLEGSINGLPDVNAKRGEGFGVALGRRNGRNLRTEAEFSYRQNDVFGSINAFQPADFTGSLTSYSGMANAYWEFIDVPTRCFKPYVGVGIGFIGVDVEANDMLGRSLIPTNADTDTSLAYQWIAGVNYKAYRNMDLFAEYRFFKADSFRVETTVPGVSGDYDYETDNLFVGLRWKF